MAYATVQDLADPPYNLSPANAQLLLDRASRDVDRALLCAVYDPADPDVIAALKLATLEQVAANLDVGDLTGMGGSKRRSFSLGRLAMQAASAEDRPRRIGSLWEQAWDVLQQAGLTGQGPSS